MSWPSKKIACVAIGILCSIFLLASLFKKPSWRPSQVRLQELSRALQKDYSLSIPTNAILLNYDKKRLRTVNTYYKVQIPEKDWHLFWDKIVQESGGILSSQLTDRDGIALPWWRAAPHAKVYFLKRDRSVPLGTVMLYLVDESKNYYIFIEKVD